MDVQCATTKAQRLIRISTVGKLDYNVFLKADVLPNQSKTSVHSAWVFATSAHVVKDTGRPVAMLLPSYGRPGSENTKPDALSKQWEPLGPDPFLESKLFPLLGSWLHTFSSLWLIMEALRQEPDPGGLPPAKEHTVILVLVTVSLRHASSCHCPSFHLPRRQWSFFSAHGQDSRDVKTMFVEVFLPAHGSFCESVLWLLPRNQQPD
ncbi:hypothetical protein AOLI_G00197680 [Acnodon oligacanthus]